MSYIGKSITNKTQIANQVIWIESNVSEYQLDFRPNSDNDILVFVNGKYYIPTAQSDPSVKTTSTSLSPGS